VRIEQISIAHLWAARQKFGVIDVTTRSTPVTIEAASIALREGSVTSVELTEAVLDRAARHDGWVGAFLVRFDETALERAGQADAERLAGTDLGPLHGIPLAVKDIIAAHEGPTTAQSVVLDPDWGAGRDAPVVRRLRESGAVIVGKTTTMEFALGLPEARQGFPVPVNPWRRECWPGGSSSGAGSGVASGFFLAGIGSDTGGSIRIPAAFCGVTGLMPTFGRVPMMGCVPLAFSLDRVGPLARTAWDCGAVLQAIADAHPRDPASSGQPAPDFLSAIDDGIAGLRIGVVREHHLEGASAGVIAAFEAAVTIFKELGARVKEVSLPLYHEVTAATMVTIGAEACANHQRNLATRWSDYTVMARRIMAIGALVSGAEYVQAQRVRRAGQQRLAAVLEDVDIIATPTTTVTAPLLDAVLDPENASRLHTMYWNGVGAPVLAVPSGLLDGLPVSLQLGAAPFCEAELLRAGRTYQRHTDWHHRVPDLEGDYGG
jgi:aspartyl-tRNA(Asn)/glutamyl-tRNA(Gln) amidotransferase subunit A